MARNNIPFIHNYCDRWCERCPFTQRCAVFEMNEDLPPEATDFESGAFVELLSQRFAETYRMLQEGAEKWGIELQEPTEEEWAQYRHDEEAVMARIEDTELIRCASAYAASVEILFTQNPLWKRKGLQLAQATTLGIQTVESGLSEVDLLADCRHVLGWYQYFIQVKFQRALHGLFGDGPEALEPQSDANGTAKIALIAVERSRLALTTMLQLVGEDDSLFDLLALLERIDKEGRATFPAAHAFRRPGFDERTTEQNH